MMVQTTTSLNLRSGPGTNNPPIGVLPDGAMGAITGQPVVSGSFTWYPVKMNGFPAGWVAGAYLTPLNITATPVSSSPTATMVSTATHTATASSSNPWSPGMMVRTRANVNLRTGPGTNYSPIGVVPNGTRGAITGSPVVAGRYTWYPVKMEGFAAGWIAGSFLTALNITATPESGASATATRTPTRTPTSVAGAIPIGSTVRTTANLRMRTGPGTSYGSVATLPNGAQGTVTGAPTSSGGFTWYPVNFPGYGTGYSAGEYLEVVGTATEPTATRTPTSSAGGFPIGAAVEATSALNLRSGPGTQFSIITLLSAGDNGTVQAGPTVGGSYQWYQVQFAGIGTGWVAGAFLQAAGVSSALPPDVPDSSDPAPVDSEADDAPTTSEAADPTVESEPSATPEGPAEPTADGSDAPAETVESIPTTVIESVIEDTPTATSTIETGPQPLPMVRVQRTEGSSEGQVLVDDDAATIWYAPGLPTAQAAVFVADLGSEQHVSRIRWQSVPEGLSGQLYLSVSSDGQTWTDLDLADVVSEEDHWSSIDLNASTVFVRFAFIAVEETPQLGGIAEVELWP